MRVFAALYGLIALVFVAIGPWVFASDWVSSSDFHACIEISSSLIALMAAAACLVYYFGQGSRFFLIVGLGFFVCGSGDLLHGILGLERLFANSGVDFSRSLPESHVAGRVVLAVIIIAAVLLEPLLARCRRLKGEVLIFSTVALALGGGASALVFALPLPQFVHPGQTISRPVDFLSALLCAGAFAVVLQRFRSSRDVFTGSLLACILLNLGGQVYMSLSRQLYDVFFDVAHWANLLSYCMPVAGITVEALGEMKTARRETAERQRSELLQRSLTETSPDFIAVLDREMTIQTMNRLHPEHRGEDVIGHSALSFISPDHQERLQAAFGRTLATGELQSVEASVDLPDGERVFLHRLNLLPGDDEQRAVVLVSTDITERNRAEQELRESEEKYKSLFECSGDASFLMTVSEEHGDLFADCNDSALSLFGCTQRDQILGKAPGVFSPAKQPDGRFSNEKGREFTTAAMAGRPQFFEWEHRRLDGTPFFVEITLNRIHSKGEALLQAVARDITERKRAEAALETERQQFASMFDGMDEVVYVSDPETYELLYVNGAGRQHWGNRVGEQCYRALQNRDGPCPFCTNDRIFGENAGQPHIWESRNEVNQRWYRCIDRAIRWSDGRMVRFELAIDIHERKQAEEQLSQRVHELSDAKHRLEVLVSSTTEREQRMVDLKQEVNDLLEALGREAKYQAPQKVARLKTKLGC